METYYTVRITAKDGVAYYTMAEFRLSPAALEVVPPTMKSRDVARVVETALAFQVSSIVIEEYKPGV